MKSVITAAFVAITLMTMSPVVATDRLDLSKGKFKFGRESVSASSCFLTEFDSWIPPTSNARREMDYASISYGVSYLTFLLGFTGAYIEVASLAVHQNFIDKSSSGWVLGGLFGVAGVLDYVNPGLLATAANSRLSEIGSDQRISIEETQHFLRSRKGIPNFDDTLKWTTVPVVYYFSKEPLIMGGFPLLALGLGATAHGKTPVTRLWIPLGIAGYNFLVAKNQTQSEVFWSNIGCWAGLLLVDALSESDVHVSTKNSTLISPEFREGKVQIKAVLEF